MCLDPDTGKLRYLASLAVVSRSSSIARLRVRPVVVAEPEQAPPSSGYKREETKRGKVGATQSLGLTYSTTRLEG